MKTFLYGAVPGALLMAGATCALAQQYPAKPIRLLIGFAAGGPSDVAARTIAQKLTEKWGQPVIVDIRPGASGLIATDIVAKAPPDGYTLIESAFAPAGTPREIVLRLNSEVARALREPDARERLYSIGAEPMSNTPEEFAAYINAEMVKWSKVIKAAGIRVE